MDNNPANQQTTPPKPTNPLIWVIFIIVVLAVAGGIWYVVNQGNGNTNTTNNTNTGVNNSNTTAQNTNQGNVNAANTNADPYAGWGTFTDIMGTYSFRYPPHWTIYSKNVPDLVLVKSPNREEPFQLLTLLPGGVAEAVEWLNATKTAKFQNYRYAGASPIFPEVGFLYRADQHPYITFIVVPFSRSTLVAKLTDEHQNVESNLVAQTIGSFCIRESGTSLTCSDVIDKNEVKSEAISLVKIVDQPNSAKKVVVSGRYAFVSNDEGFSVVDISDPTRAYVVKTITDKKLSGSSTIIISNSLLALVCGYQGTYVYDIQDPRKPKELFFTQISFESAALKDKKLFLVKELEGLIIYDITYPEEITKIAQMDTPGKPTDIEIVGSKAYIADSRLYDVPGRLMIVDISDPRKLKILSSTVTKGKAERLSVVGDYVYVADSSDGGVTVFNVADASHPRIVNSLGPVIAEDTSASDGFVVVGTRRKAIFLWDVNDPENPIYKGYNNQVPNSWDVLINDKHIFIAGGKQLYILQINR